MIPRLAPGGQDRSHEGRRMCDSPAARPPGGAGDAPSAVRVPLEQMEGARVVAWLSSGDGPLSVRVRPSSVTVPAGQRARVKSAWSTHTRVTLDPGDLMARRLADQPDGRAWSSMLRLCEISLWPLPPPPGRLAGAFDRYRRAPRGRDEFPPGPAFAKPSRLIGSRRCPRRNSRRL